MEEGEGRRGQGDGEAARVHPDAVPERAAPGQGHGLPAGGRGRHAARAAAVAGRAPAACGGPAGGAEVSAPQPRGAGVFGRDTTLFTRPVKIPKLYNFHSFESILGFDCKRNAGEPI